MVIERLCHTCGKPKKITKIKVKTVCNCEVNYVEDENLQTV